MMTETELTPYRELQRLHGLVFDLPSGWAKHLEGSYFPTEVLQRLDTVATPLWYLNHGSRSLARSSHCNTLLVRTVLRERGVTLTGPPPRELVAPVPNDVLRREMQHVMLSWGREILDNPNAYRNRFYQGYLVLNFARMLHDLHVGRPGSKRSGAQWAKAVLAPEWSDLIDTAWLTRPNPALSVRQPPDGERFERTLAFVGLCMREAQDIDIR